MFKKIIAALMMLALFIPIYAFKIEPNLAVVHQL